MTLLINKEGHESAIVNIEYWMSPISLESYLFLLDFKNVFTEFGKNITFTPTYKFKNLAGTANDTILEKYCFAHGKYCVENDDKSNGIQSLNEGIRQICVWRLADSEDENRSLWWNYIEKYSSCLQKSHFAGINDKQLCYGVVYESLELKKEKIDLIEDCLKNSFTNKNLTTYESDNEMLKSQFNKSVYSGIYIVPAMFLNKELVKENLSINQAIGALCSKFLKKNEFCKSYKTNKFVWKSSRPVLSQEILALIFVLVVVGMVILILIVCVIKGSVHENIQQEVDSRIRNHVTDYMKLKENSVLRDK